MHSSYSPLIVTCGVVSVEHSVSAASTPGEKRNVAAVESLIAVLADPTCWAASVVRGAAASSLGRIGDPWAVGPLTRVLQENVSWRARARAAATLEAIGDSKAASALSEALQDADPLVRNTAGAALGKLNQGEYLLQAEVVVAGSVVATGVGLPW